ncbi:MAG: sensor histidine kinase [Marvinbryantia sp.]|jgi:signal transduction histidine kinase
MKLLSLKAKLTLLYTLLMTAVVCAVFAILFSFSNQEILTGVGSQLEERVADARGDLFCTEGTLEIDSDFLELKDGIYLSLYNTNGVFLYGKIPYGFKNTIPFEDGNVRKIQNGNTQYYVLDMIYDIPDYGITDIRGIVSVSAAEKTFLLTIRFALILLPLIVIATAALGYFMTKRTLRPVDEITRTVQAIRKDSDLSRRVGLRKGNDEIYRLAATFDSMLAQLEESLMRERQFTSDVAHELRTPLSTMTLLCENLLFEETLSESVRKDILLLQKKVAGLSRMVSQLLIISRADRGQAKIELEHLNLSELAVLACEEVRDIASSKNISVLTNIEPDLFISGDETLLIRFFLNLLKNAVSYGNSNGQIRVTLKKSAADSGQITGSISDNGIGISTSDLPHIWERFFQADPSRSETESSGLGLSMVAWIIKEHHGEITVKSTLGKGTTFTFFFPAD